MDAETSTWQLAKDIAEAEGIQYEPDEESSHMMPVASPEPCHAGRCMCSKAGRVRPNICAMPG